LDLSASQLASGTTTSYWTCSFVTASDNHQYLALSITMWRAGIPITGGILIDATDPSYVERYTRAVPGAVAPSESGEKILNATIGTSSIMALTDDNVSVLRSISDYANLTFDLTFEATSPIVYQGGLGSFALNGQRSYEWAIPAGRTTGSITARGKKLTVDPKRSFTWYDRQWSVNDKDIPAVSGSANYTWFQINLPTSGIKASIWAVDYAETGEQRRVATFRYPDGGHLVLPYEFVPDSSSVYVSPRTQISYATKYTLKFPGRGSIKVSTIRQDQEVWSGNQGTWEGFAEFEANVLGFREKGFGVLEIIPALETA
jgi:predicted secreted hydrolase